MVTLELNGDTFVITIKGLHKFWALKSSVSFKKSSIIHAALADPLLRPAPLRMPGTYLPRVIAAGTFYGKKRKEFWDVVFTKPAIEIELKDEKYTKIVVNVLDCTAALALLNQ